MMKKILLFITLGLLVFSCSNAGMMPGRSIGDARKQQMQKFPKKTFYTGNGYDSGH